MSEDVKLSGVKVAASVALTDLLLKGYTEHRDRTFCFASFFFFPFFESHEYQYNLSIYSHDMTLSVMAPLVILMTSLQTNFELSSNKHMLKV